jgi:hypothetical protein
MCFAGTSGTCDGQHKPEYLPDMVRTLKTDDTADMVTGSRFLKDPGYKVPIGRRLGNLIFAVVLSGIVRQRITDPTSGFWCYGPRATRLLRRHHPTGYPEPELLLLLVRNGLRVGEVPIRVRPRRAGQTSLTPARTGLAFARTVVALVLVPVRRAVRID